jgi:hypothetical protein
LFRRQRLKVVIDCVTNCTPLMLRYPLGAQLKRTVILALDGTHSQIALLKV